uniref:Uncharacterized protein n=1 Tax=Arundo donax TaxID=35708 RepID=A0A0A9GX57_ARUDO
MGSARIAAEVRSGAEHQFAITIKRAWTKLWQKKRDESRIAEVRGVRASAARIRWTGTAAPSAR